ncbi:MAG: DUF2304 domain-containing protein [archaeon]|nr:DUF2304 domain-containing protein [archaeon]
MATRQIIFFSLTFSISLFLVLSMIIKYQLKEVYAVIWLLVISLIPCVILAFPFIKKISILFGIYSPINFLYFIAITTLFGLSLHFSALNSGFQRCLKNSIQKIAILEEEIDCLNNKITAIEMKSLNHDEDLKHENQVVIRNIA